MDTQINDSEYSGRQDEDKQIIIELLRLTAAGKAKWWRSNAELNYLHCIVCDELFLFDVHDESGRFDRESGGFSLEARNQSFLWLTDLEGWEEVVELLLLGRQALIDDEQYHQLRHRCRGKILHGLKAIMS